LGRIRHLSLGHKYLGHKQSTVAGRTKIVTSAIGQYGHITRRRKMSQGRRGSIGVIGLGIMGGAFAKHLAAAGWKVVGYDVDPARCKAMARLGVTIAKDVKAVADAVPHILTSLPH